MSVAELLSILERRRLILHQFRTLRRADRAEGSIPDDLYDRDQVLSANPEARAHALRANTDLSYSTYVQCWHRSSREHSAFWQIYGNRGVAIQTTIRKITAQKFWTDHSLKGDDIVYADTWAEMERHGFAVPEGIMPNRMSMRRKRHAFSWEKEWRIFYKPPASIVGVVDASLPPAEHAVRRAEWRRRLQEHQEIAIESLTWISKVVTAPGAPPWVVDSICATAQRHKVQCRASIL